MRRKIIGALALVLIAAVAAYAVSTVSSYSPPKLVSEINTALANPSVTTLTTPAVTANGGESATLTLTLPTTQATNSVITSLGIVGDSSLTYLDWLIKGTNDSAETITYLKERLTVTDYTTNTEDVTVAYTVPVGGTDTAVLTLGGAAEVTASKLTVSGTLGVTGAATFTHETATIGGRQAVVAHALGAPYSAATKLAIFTTNVTMHAGTVWTQALTYTTGILAAHATYTEDPGDVRPLYVNSMVTNEVQVTATADKNFCLTVIGIP